jgi:hypothetical protein
MKVNWSAVYYWTRYWIIIISSIGISGIFWGMMGAGLGRWLFGLDEETALLWIALPIFIVSIPYCVLLLPKDYRKTGILGPPPGRDEYEQP